MLAPVEAFSFESERLGMRPWRAQDLDAFFAIWGDPRVIWWGKAFADRAFAAERLAFVIEQQPEHAPGQGRFAAVAKDTGEVIGNVILRPAAFDEGVEVGYHFAHHAWGRGHATEAARACLRHGFERVGLPRIIAGVALQNTRSLRVMEKLGMRAYGEKVYSDLPHRLFEALRPQA
jgi:ribosomal-protein-alanine N-acetyltransferase